MRTISKSVISTPMAIPQSELSSSGAPMNMQVAPRYIGCRTTPYTPVETTCCSRSRWILTSGERKVLSWKARKRKKDETSSRAPPTIFSPSGNADVHWNRRASSGITVNHAKDKSMIA
ncbi:hypothetical protein D3C86_1859040 [compost metagenome]